MKALVLSGGTGSRLRPFSFSMPKQLFPIANRPILEHVLENIRKLGVTEVGLVVGDWQVAIADAIGDGSRFGVKVTYIRQDRPLGLGHCVTVAQPFLGDDDFVMYLGDNVLPDGIGSIADEFRSGRPAAQVVTCRVPDPRPFGVVELDQHGVVRRLVEKPTRPTSDLALIGVYFFTAKIHEAVAATAPSARGELEITDAIQWLLTIGADVRASEYVGFWKDAGRAEDMLDCNRRLLGDLHPAIAGSVDTASELRGSIVVGPGARILRSRIEGPVIIGANTVVENTYLGPYTSIGADCWLRSTSITNSILLDGAAVSDLPGLRDSLIGRRAAVHRNGTSQRLVIGDHARLEVVA